MEGCRQARRRALLHAKNVHSRPRAALRHRWDCDRQGAWYAGRSLGHLFLDGAETSKERHVGPLSLQCEKSMSMCPKLKLGT